jgi:Contractile injection system tube protein
MSLKKIASKFASKLTHSGEVTKLKITAYRKEDFTDNAGEFDVSFNPVSLNLKLQIDRVETKVLGQPDGSAPQVAIPSQDFSFDFIIDGTGFEGGRNAIANSLSTGDEGKESHKYVSGEIAKLLTLVYKYEGEKHQSNYIEILYGTILIQCVLSSIDITYTLFDKAGMPLRAKVSLSFKTTGKKQLQDIIANAQSPDLTHIRELKQHDHFLNMSNKMYDDNYLYVQVARANNMNSIRENKTGNRIVFPPIIEQENSSI